MNECTEFEMRELLPDVLHGSLGQRERARVDTGRVVRQITPYGIVVPVVEPTAGKRRLKRLMAAAVVLAVAGGGGSILMRSGADRGTPSPVAMAEPTFTLTADVGNLSDSELAQLISEMSEFDALPAGDPEPVLMVDTPDLVEQDSL